MRRPILRGLILILGLAALLVPGIATRADTSESSSVQTTKVEASAKPADEAAGREHEVIEFDAPTAIWVLIIFAVLLIVLYPTAWKNVLAGLKAREAKIRGDIAEAESARTKAETTLRDYSAKLADAEKTVREMISKAVTEAEAIGVSIRAKAQQESEETKEKAIKEIEGAKTAALGEVYDQTATLATNVAEKILRRSLNANDQRDLVTQSLEQMQAVNKN